MSRGSALDSIAALIDNSWYWARAHARPLVRWQVPVARITGRAVGSGQERTVVVAGWQRTVAYYVQRFLETMSEPVNLGTVPVLRLPATLRRLREDCDLVVARVPGPASGWLFDDFYLHVPEAVEARLAVPEDSAVLAVASSRAKRNMARVRENGLTWTVSTDPVDFTSFYDDYYVPFLRRRFGDLAHEVERVDLLKVFRQGCIMWVLKDGQRLVGALFSPGGSVLRWRVMGAAMDGQDLARIGALSAIYLFGVELAAQYGFRWLDLGFSKASPRDGVLSHKASWGASVYCPWKVDHDVLVGWRRFTDEVAGFLRDTPLIFRDGGGLSAVTALSEGDRNGGADPAAFGQKSSMRGLRRVFCVGAATSQLKGTEGRYGAAFHAAPPVSSSEFTRLVAKSDPVDALPGEADSGQRTERAGQPDRR